jgi:DNA-binding NarL/FixJ family response regulator
MENLTQRELEVLKLICNGLSTKEVAAKLGIAFKTAACHRQRILNKVRARNSVGLLRWAIQNGYATVERLDEPDIACRAANWGR